MQNAELEAKHQKYKGRVVLVGDVVENNSGSYLVVTEQGPLPFWLKPFLFKTALLARVRLLHFGVVVQLSATTVHGTQPEVGFGGQFVRGRLANSFEGTPVHLPRHGLVRRTSLLPSLPRRSFPVQHRRKEGATKVTVGPGTVSLCTTTVMLLRRDPGGKVTKEELCHRFDLFVSGELATLWQEATGAIRAIGGFRLFAPQTDEKRAAAACRRVQMGEVTRARQCLTRDALAPGNDATLQELQSRRPQEVQRDIPRPSRRSCSIG